MTNLLSNDQLPEWDLTDLYPSTDDPRIHQDLENCLKEAEKFQKTYAAGFSENTLNAANTLAQAISTYEKTNETLGRLSSYAGLLYYKNLGNSTAQQFYQFIQEKLTQISGFFVFFTLEINKIDTSLLDQWIKSSQALSQYASWLRTVRLFKTHQLDEKTEKLFLEKSLTSRNAWVRLYDETLAEMRFTVDGKILTLPAVTDLMNHKDSLMRKRAAMALSEGLRQKLSLFTMITNTLAKDKEIEDTWRSYAHPTHERHLSNQLTPEVVEALTSTIKANYQKLSHRYYALKAKLLGVQTIHYWDRNAPLPRESEKSISWLEARQIVLEAYQAFSPEMAAIAHRFFDNNWLDVPVKEGKTSGAFSHPTVPSVHPYILLNFQGRLRDVMTLAHELGHGIHQVLAAPQGYLQADTPLTLAETASVFGEMLTFQALLKNETNAQERAQLLAAKIEDMLNTVVRQVAFYDFECRVHEARQKGELSADDICQFFIETQQQALGPSVNVDDLVGCFWAYISHFIHSPFYVYAYAFGDCLVNSLYAVYEKDSTGFLEKYHDLLKAGGTKTYDQLLAPFGLNATSPDFWQGGLSMIDRLISQLEETLNG